MMFSIGWVEATKVIQIGMTVMTMPRMTTRWEMTVR